MVKTEDINTWTLPDVKEAVVYFRGESSCWSSGPSSVASVIAELVAFKGLYCGALGGRASEMCSIPAGFTGSASFFQVFLSCTLAFGSNTILQD